VTKRRRVGTVTLGVKYTVDVDDQEMVERAKECLFEDVYHAIVKAGDRAEFESMIAIVSNPKLKVGDIDPFLLEDEEDE
jgi:sporulation-control protein spo0M